MVMFALNSLKNYGKGFEDGLRLNQRVYKNNWAIIMFVLFDSKIVKELTKGKLLVKNRFAAFIRINDLT